MFRLISLKLYSFKNEEYIYQFSNGINYFKGKNSSGKTEFYNFIDYMFGKKDDLEKKMWYKGTLKKASMEMQVNEIKYTLTRVIDPSMNFLHYSNKEEGESIDLREYKDRLNSIFTKDIQLLRDMYDFTDENFTYRTFTMFNFLGEKNQGAINDFFDKCKDIRYSVKLTPLLNFIFNKNIKRIHESQKKLELLQKEAKNLEANKSKHNFICSQINNNLKKLGLNHIDYDGTNSEEVKESIRKIKDMEEIKKINKDINISKLEVLYSNVSEQIKIYENTIADAKQFNTENKNRRKLLEKLDILIKDNDDFSYLIFPLKQLLSELENSISFSQYTISDNTIIELKKQKSFIKDAIKSNDSRFKCYSIEDKVKAISLIEDYLNSNIQDCTVSLNDIKIKIKKIKEEIKILQNLDDSDKIENLSQFITSLYASANGISSIVDDDILQNGFKIQYLKKGNVLQPMIDYNENNENDCETIKKTNYYIGSMARHTLIQLCGYLGFLKMLLNENKYPIIPILVIDHISKPFDSNNAQAIGIVINKFYDFISKDEIQIFMFDDEEYETLSLNPDHYENLVAAGKTGFNPFYHSKVDIYETENYDKEEND